MVSSVFPSKTELQSQRLLGKIHSGQVFVVEGKKGNALILCHPYYCEIVGPKSAVGTPLDRDCQQVILLGEVTLRLPDDSQEKAKAYKNRQKWISATQKVVDQLPPLKRITTIIEMIQDYCGTQAVNNLSDEIIAKMVGVEIHRVTEVRHQLSIES